MSALFLLLLALAAPAAAAGPDSSPGGDAVPRGDVVIAVATIAKKNVTVGETFALEVRATGPAGTTFSFAPEARQESFELSTAPADSNPPLGTHRYQAALFALDATQVPPIPVRYRLPDGTEGEAQTAPVAIEVGSLLPKAKDEQKLADIKGPVDAPIGRAFWIGLFALLLVLAALVYLIVSRRRPKAPPAPLPVPVLEPAAEARGALDALVASGLLSRGEYRRFYIELTTIAKRYLERRLGAPILEMTTAETLAHLRSTPEAVSLAPTLRDLTGAADQIKFAKGSVLQDVAERHLAAARGLVAELETSLEPAAAPAAPAASSGPDA